MINDMERPCCIICGEQRGEGIQICSEFICVDCEAEILRTDAQDAKYPFFIHRMRRIWYKENA